MGKTEVRTDLYNNLLKQRVLLLEDNIDDIAEKYFVESLALLEKERSPIYIKINSSGGNSLNSLVIFDLIKGLDKHIMVYGDVSGQASSMAFLILQACSTRRMTKNSFLLPHLSQRRLSDISINWQTPINKLQYIVRNIHEETIKRQNECFRLISEKSGLPTESIEKIYVSGEKIGAEEALQLNLIDGIL